MTDSFAGLSDFYAEAEMTTDIFAGLSDKEIFDMGFELGDISRIMSLRQPIVNRPVFEPSRRNIIAAAGNHNYRCTFSPIVQADGLVVKGKLNLTALPLGVVRDYGITVKNL